MSNAPFRIIIIDDNAEIHRDFIKILQISNQATQLSKLDNELFGEEESKPETGLPAFEIETASQGEEGVLKVKAALNEGNPFALAFVDIRMPPGIDGVETIKRIWELDPDIQTVICTAYSDYSWEETVNELGVNDNLLILKKPFDVITVRQLASALTRKWLIAKDTQKHTNSLNQLVDERTKSLKQSFALLRATIESSSDGILVVDLDGKLVDYNRNFIKFLAIPESILKQNNQNDLHQHILNQLKEPEKYQHFVNLQYKKIDDSSIQILRFNNNRVFECYSKPHRVDKKIVGRVWSFHDITEQTDLKEKLEYQATHDVLTNLSNRALLVDRIWQAIAHATRYNTKFAVFFLDLDRFKFVNDNLSHEIGDHLLCEVAKRLKSVTRAEDTISRLGGDEFVMVFGIKNEDQANAIATKVTQLFSQPFNILNHMIRITASIGISIYPNDGKTENALMKNADLAMYEAKAQNGNQFIFYTEELNQKSVHQFKIEEELQKALENHEFFLHFQPQFDINNQKILSVEALLRWNHPEKGILYPIQFLAVAENSNLIVPIGEWVLHEACRQLKKWNKMGLPEIKIAVNIATKQLRQHNFPDTLINILKKYDIPPKYIEMEITENVIISSEIQETIRHIKSLGFNIILDDFGTGNSSLNTLKELHIDRLKIDKSFVQNISKSRGDEAIVEAIIAISHSMNFKVIAEGIESQIQIDFLKKKSCDVIQGFLWGEPISTEELESLLKNQKNTTHERKR